MDLSEYKLVISIENRVDWDSLLSTFFFLSFFVVVVCELCTYCHSDKQFVLLFCIPAECEKENKISMSHMYEKGVVKIKKINNKNLILSI